MTTSTPVISAIDTKPALPEQLSPEQAKLKDALKTIVTDHLFGGPVVDEAIDETVRGIAVFVGKDASGLGDDLAGRVRQSAEWNESMDRIAELVYQLATDLELTVSDAESVRAFLMTDAGQKWNDVSSMVSLPSKTEMLQTISAVVAELPDLQIEDTDIESTMDVEAAPKSA